MSAAMLRVHRLQHVAQDEAISPRPRCDVSLVDFDLDRSSESRHRYRALVSARQLLALFDYPGDHKQRLH